MRAAHWHYTSKAAPEKKQGLAARRALCDPAFLECPDSKIRAQRINPDIPGLAEAFAEFLDENKVFGPGPSQCYIKLPHRTPGRAPFFDLLFLSGFG